MLIEKVMNAWPKPAGLLGVLAAVAGTVLLAAQPAFAQQQTEAGLSTPKCGLSNKQAYPTCPGSSDDERVVEGYTMNQMPLNLTGRDLRKVGIGSYWVNSAGACTGCHRGQAAANGNPAHLPIALGGDYAGNYHSNTAVPYNPTLIQDPTVFLAGGANFGSGNCDAAGVGGCGATEIVTRNLTPDFTTGKPMPEKNTLKDFITTLRTGHDFQKVHVQPGQPTTVAAPADGSRLQIMPWPALGSATNYDLELIYEYLSAIPCISNAGSKYPEIINKCPAPMATDYGTATYHKYTFANGQVELAK